MDELFQRLERAGVKVPKYVRQADELSAFAVLTRYPRLAGPVTKRQYRRAVRLARWCCGGPSAR
jgi:hypothetical protein